ncbi:hypothetical protein GKQ77_04380 [Streptomyces sp. BG9H]|uniref:Secreted protein n=1 Tax=Streptomyces anatolicus TaxID=2675858 RepID=A0ABS6YHC4_9ACTN|nr:hypothetical protein [Streptomyces anatolicus]MBW5420809.1 hypothetical protein [Streptomyces anatolicus]
MRKKISVVAVVVAGLLSLAAAPVAAADSGGTGGTGRTGTACGSVKLSGALPAPPPGMTAQQKVTIGPDCEPRQGKVEFVPAKAGRASTAAAADSRQLRSWSEMFDCCNIRMTGLYTASTWNTEADRITDASTTVTHGWNREPWNAGWSLKSSDSTEDCTRDCAVSKVRAHAEFGYQGIFDPTGGWYANTHDSAIELRSDGTAQCTFDVDLRHTFVGWNWVRGCS